MNSTASQQPTDLELCLALEADRATAFDQIYRRYHRLVSQTAYRVLGNLQEAEDLAQEIFLHLWHRWSYNPARGSLTSFLRTLTRSRAIDRLRSQDSDRRCLGRYGREMAFAPVTCAPLEWAVHQEQRRFVARALTHLPVHQHRVLQLAYYGGLSQTQIAARLGAPLGTVKSWARQGQISLRRELACI